MDINLTEFNVRQTNPWISRTNSLPENVERYTVKAQGLIGIDIFAGDKINLINTEGGQICEVIVFDEKGRNNHSIINQKENNDGEYIKYILTNDSNKNILLQKLNKKNINPVVSITVTHENCENIEEIFHYFTDTCKIDSLKCCLVRDEGVYSRPKDKVDKIIVAYDLLTNKILDYQKKNKIINYNSNSIQGRINNKKDRISWNLVKKIYSNNEYISPCHASSLFGIITADGKLYPCEILEDKMIGSLRDVDMDLMKLWNGENNQNIKNHILSTKCKCTYECGLSFNILGNWRYQYKLLSGLLSKY